MAQHSKTMRIAAQAIIGLTMALAAPPPTVVAQATEIASAPAPPPAASRAALVEVISHAADTPGGRSYLQIAHEEVAVARRHVLAALASGDDAAFVKRQVAAALHAVDPQLGVADDDLGYGLRPALQHAMGGMAAAAAVVARDERAAQVTVAVEAALRRVNEAADFGRAALVSGSPEVVRQGARGMSIALGRAAEGWDRDGDGTIDWRRGEAGLQQAETAARSLAAVVAGL